MLKYSVITLFPELFTAFKTTSIIKRAQQQAQVVIDLVALRQFGHGKHHQVDAYSFGGDHGMVLQIAPLVAAIRAVKTPKSRVCLMTPHGRVLTQAKAQQLARCQHLILVCGRYEGFDERIHHYVDDTISIGDYVLNGGELPAMVLIETVSRLVPGVIKQTSTGHDSFTQGLLDYPLYAPPVKFEQYIVPTVLRSGHHEKIATWRARAQVTKTLAERPDLLAHAKLTPEQQQWFEYLVTTKGNKVDYEF